MNYITRMLATAFIVAAVAPTSTTAQEQRHVLIVTGLSGDAGFARRFTDAARQIYDSARTRWGVPDANVTWFAENPATDPRRIRGRATREAIAGALSTIASRAVPGDVVLVVVIGHGSGEGDASRISLAGADPTARDVATWLLPLERQRVAVVIAASGSGDFVPVLAQPGRVVITAAKSATERNESIFPAFIARGLTTDAADADKDGGVTLLEAFTFARAGVAQQYIERSHLLTEHAQLSDESAARRIVVGRRMPVSSDPRVTVLLAERRALEEQVEQLRARKAATDSVVYQRDLERLLLAIATKSLEIRTLPPQARP